MRNKIVFLALILAVIIPVTMNAISESALMYMLIEPGSRSAAMGQAYVAQADDGFAGYWNPGALAFNRKNQFASMYSNWFGEVFPDIYYFFAAWDNYYEDIGNIGINATYMSYGKQERTDLNGHSDGTFSSYDMCAAVTYGYQASPKTGLGITFKFIYSDLAPQGTGETEQDENGLGISYAFDLGLKHKGADFGQILVSPYNGLIAAYNGIGSLAGFGPANYSKYSIPIEKLDFGFNLQNIGPNITYINESQADPLPMNWRMGFSYRVLDSQYNKLRINADMNKLLANDDPVYQRIFTAWTDDFNTQTDDAGKKIDDFSSIHNFINSLELREIIWCIGAEYEYLDLLSLRGGYYLDRAGDVKGPSFGFGVHYLLNKAYLIGIDYAFQPGGELQDYNQTLSVKVEF
ncbi:MAG TPA: PorV/PorQ family protein [Candidatus Cloacimonadota bacterium]|nr:PorV/PorQ family protein [Candidatus Cloacimonadota bacterium]